MTIDLIAAWPEIAGEQHAQYSQPHKLAWPSHVEAHEEFKPATLVIICEGARSIYLMHDSTAVIERVNAYFGFVAVDRLQVKQVAVKDLPRSKMPPPPALGAKDEQRLSRMLDHVEDDELRQSLSRMGRGIFSERSQ